MPDTDSAIQLGKTTATKGGIVIQIDLQIYDSEEPLYVWLKTNAGSVQVDKIMITYAG